MGLKTKRNLLLVVCGLWLCLGQPARAYQKEIDQTARTIAEKLQASSSKTIAVVDFTDLNGNVTELGRFIAEKLSSALAENDGLRVIDRIHLRSILQEHKLAASGLIDPATARRLGEIAGVQALVTGTMTEFGDSVRLSAKVLDTATAQIHASVRSDVPKTEAIKELLGRVTGGAGERLGSKTTEDRAQQPIVHGEQVQQVQEFSITLQRCQADRRDIVCHLVITVASQEDRNITLQPRNCQIVSYDNLGREYQPSRLEIGASTDESWLVKTLLAGVPTPTSIRFKLAGSTGYQNSSPELQSLTAVKVSFFYNYRCLSVTFRNIPVRAAS